MLNYAKNNILYTEVAKYDKSVVFVRRLWSHRLIARYFVDSDAPIDNAALLVEYMINNYYGEAE